MREISEDRNYPESYHQTYGCGPTPSVLSHTSDPARLPRMQFSEGVKVFMGPTLKAFDEASRASLKTHARGRCTLPLRLIGANLRRPARPGRAAFDLGRTGPHELAVTDLGQMKKLD
ncbi:hypothetical protein EVAR_10536_1 [Eumeta japonica]|uniref:Uncharacterized protein n=1 Tax=Eumeta variegata TaxID=151549 RepID=A0A4C1TK56_EUMVA|nr:hypothetical protein EVAR_10536_1 [Eumeta japonica]